MGAGQSNPFDEGSDEEEDEDDDNAADDDDREPSVLSAQHRQRRLSQLAAAAGSSGSGVPDGLDAVRRYAESGGAYVRDQGEDKRVEAFAHEIWGSGGVGEGGGAGGGDGGAEAGRGMGRRILEVLRPDVGETRRGPPVLRT